MTLVELILELKKINVVLRLVNHQLVLAGQTAAIPSWLMTEVQAVKPALINLLHTQATTRNDGLVHCGPQQSYPVTPAQQRIWVLSQLEDDGAAYHITRALQFRGVADVVRFNRAISDTLASHDIFNTVFAETADGLRQAARSTRRADVAFTDLRHDINPQQSLAACIDKAASLRFNLANGPLLHVQTFLLPGDALIFVISIHHIITDGGSLRLLLQEVLYRYGVSGTGNPGTPANLRYTDYAYWMNDRLKNGGMDAARIFWQQEFNEMPPPLALPLDFSRPAARSSEGALARFYLGEAMYRRIRHFCRERQVTVFSFLRLAVSVLLQRLSGESDIVLGVPVSGRTRAKLETMQGLFVNTLPLRSSIRPDWSVEAMLQELSRHGSLALQYQEFPFEKIVEAAGVPPHDWQHPLFEVMLSFQDISAAESLAILAKEQGLELTVAEVYAAADAAAHHPMPVKFDLCFNFDFDPVNGFVAEIEYRTRLLQPATISRWYDILAFLMEQMMRQPTAAVSSLSITTPGEREQILQQFNHPVNAVQDWNITALLAPSFERNGSATAVVFKDRSLSYTELQALSDAVAATIVNNNFSNNRPFVGVLMSRSEWLLVAILGILKSGAAYVPVDIQYPDTRIGYIIDDAQPELIITDEAGRQKIPEQCKATILDIHNMEPDAMAPPVLGDRREQPAYLIYTSGSTGTPKGVEICHRNAIAFLNWAMREFEETPYDMVYAATSHCFDLSIFEFFVPLLQGKTIRILESALDIPAYAATDARILLNTVPSVVRHLLDGGGMNWQQVTALNMAGEPVPKILKSELDYHRIEIRNLYGPSEDTTYSTVYRFRDDVDYPSVPIGVPLTGTRLYILDAQRNLLPVGVEGEIYLSGHGVANGYLNKPDITSQSFLDDPFIPGLRMYKTGDMGKWTPDGMVLFAGRNDDQVKLRGYRIELGEIQFRLEQHEAIAQAAVLVREVHQSQELVAYWVSSREIAPHEMKTWLGAQLPGYMVPAYGIRLAEMPLNSNGKVDKKRLPQPEAGVVVAAVPPQNELQARLLNIWRQVLPQQELGVEHNFFASGGHSLKALQLRWLVLEQLDKAISIQEIFAHPTITAQSALLDTRQGAVGSRIPVAAQQPFYPISFAQERLWVLTGFKEASKAYHMPAAFLVHGSIDITLFRQALEAVVNRFEILRTVFRTVDGLPVQVIHPAGGAGVAFQTVAPKNVMDAAAESEFLRKQWLEPFDLETGPLFRCLLLENGSRRILSFNMHHIISDGWSVAVLLRHISETLRAFENGGMEPAAANAIQYKDFAVWQRSQLESGAMQASRQFWQQQFAGDIPVLELPYDFKRPVIKTYSGHTVEYRLPASTLDGLQALCAQAGITLFTLLSGMVAVLLRKYSGQSELVIGTPVAGRAVPELQGQPGLFVNTLPLRFHVQDDLAVTAFLQRQQAYLLETFAQQSYPFELLVDDLQLSRDASRSPLFDVMVVLQNPDGLLQTDNWPVTDRCTLERLNISAGTAKFDCSFQFESYKDGLLLALEYNTGLFQEATIVQMARRLAFLLEQVLAQPGITPGNLQLLDVNEKSLLLEAFNKPVDAITEYNIISLLAPAFHKTPGNIAVTAASGSFTYFELEGYANAVAEKIRPLLQPNAPAFVGVLMERSHWMPAVLIGILKAGAAYVPVDIQYPASRIAYILEDAAPALVIADEAGMAHVPETYTGVVIGLPDTVAVNGQISINTGEDLREQAAYLIYTSGSTGKPKGVEICHRNVIAFLKWAGQEFAQTAFDICYATTSYCFDLSVFEIFFPLMQGKTIRILPSALKIPDYIAHDHNVLINTVPSAVRALLDSGMDWNHVVALNMAGEPIPQKIRDEINFDAIEVRNLYGPSEDTTYSTCYRFANDGYPFIPIGRPVGFTQLYILDSAGQLLPPGINGEIYLSGQSVAKGYYGKPVLTAEKFIPNPFVPGLTMYKTGDTGYWLPDGQVAFTGRADEQVKLRGYRIEPGEIQYQIEQHPQVREAVVLVAELQGDARLVAWYTGDSDAVPDILRSYLAQKLPSWMIPDTWMYLEAIPLNSNGKVDRKALPQPVLNAAAGKVTAAPRHDTDTLLIQIWEDVLQINGVGITDNFFNMGGNSLKAVKAFAKIYETFGVKVDMEELFIDPTVAHLADYIEMLKWAGVKQELAGAADDEVII